MFGVHPEYQVHLMKVKATLQPLLSSRILRLRILLIILHPNVANTSLSTQDSSVLLCHIFY